jgi:hypothetical protein
MSQAGPKRQFAASQPYVRSRGVKPTCHDSSTDAFGPIADIGVLLLPNDHATRLTTFTNGKR